MLQFGSLPHKPRSPSTSLIIPPSSPISQQWVGISMHCSWLGSLSGLTPLSTETSSPWQRRQPPSRGAEARQVHSAYHRPFLFRCQRVHGDLTVATSRSCGDVAAFARPVAEQAHRAVSWANGIWPTASTVPEAR
ncbi:hypothetical protein Vafri_3560 [Volvox africanus]|uniref:Uncharacterized protein n=1 Tax=Volvox africanus TaxID=51714 RepID=A0A8J4AT89_9CHLO|nr:hypothetical protein Vafri_3560 [Volvox africanus]